MGEWDNSRMHDPAYMAERIASCEAEIARGLSDSVKLFVRCCLPCLLAAMYYWRECRAWAKPCWSVRLAKFLTCHLNEYSLRRI